MNKTKTFLIAVAAMSLMACSGSKTERKAEPIAVETDVLPAMPVASLLNINKVRVVVSVSEKEIADFTPNTPTVISVEALGGRTYQGGTITMSDLLDAQSSYQQSHDQYVDAYIDYQQNLLKYRQATGQ